MQAVRRPMARSATHLDRYSRILRTEVAPLRSQLGGMRWSVFAGNVDQTIACWDNVVELAASVTGDALEGIQEIAEAFTEMEPVENTIASVNEAGEKASRTVEEKVTTAWEELHRKADRLHRRLLDVGYGARMRATETGAHLAAMVNQPGRVDSLKMQLEATLREARFLVDEKVDEASEKFHAETEERLEAAAQMAAAAEAKMRAGLEKVRQARTQRAAK